MILSLDTEAQKTRNKTNLEVLLYKILPCLFVGQLFLYRLEGKSNVGEKNSDFDYKECPQNSFNQRAPSSTLKWGPSQYSQGCQHFVFRWGQKFPVSKKRTLVT